MTDTASKLVETLFGIPQESLWSELILIAAILLVAVISFFVMDLIMKFAAKMIAKTATTWDDDIFNAKMQYGLSLAAPVTLLCMMFKEFEASHPRWGWMDAMSDLITMGAIVWVLFVLVTNLYAAFYKRPKLRPYAIKGVFQMVKLIIIALGIISAVGVIINKSPTAIFAAIGGAAAVMMFVFKDTLLGLVASIQLSANDMIHRGDWIVCDSQGANGEVQDISLTVIKVKNWDNSISTIPPYALVSESFRNYQPMRNSGGRRVERSIIIDANSVRFCSEQELDSLRHHGWLDGLDIDEAAKQINLQLLRRYLEHFLEHDKRVVHDMLMMVRQMPPTSTGLPLNLYFFVNEVGWKEYERVQSDIFDHVYATIGEFGLRVYQLPAGADLTKQ